MLHTSCGRRHWNKRSSSSEGVEIQTLRFPKHIISKAKVPRRVHHIISLKTVYFVRMPIRMCRVRLRHVKLRRSMKRVWDWILLIWWAKRSEIVCIISMEVTIMLWQRWYTVTMVKHVIISHALYEQVQNIRNQKQVEYKGIRWMMYTHDRLLQSLEYLYLNGTSLEYQLRVHSLREKRKTYNRTKRKTSKS